MKTAGEMMKERAAHTQKLTTLPSTAAKKDEDEELLLPMPPLCPAVAHGRIAAAATRVFFPTCGNIGICLCRIVHLFFLGVASELQDSRFNVHRSADQGETEVTRT